MSAITNRLYTGREYDRETGLYYLRARYYNSQTHRFLQRDPLGNVDSLNLYLYVTNNPLKWTDRSGMKAKAALQEVGSFLGVDKAGKLAGAELCILSSAITGDKYLEDAAISSFEENKEEWQDQFLMMAIPLKKGKAVAEVGEKLLINAGAVLSKDAKIINNLTHYFKQEKHLFGPLLKTFKNNQAAAANAIITVTEAKVKKMGLIEGEKYRVEVFINGIKVWVSWIIHNGEVRVGTMWVPK